MSAAIFAGKLTPTRLARKAIVYLRQSSERQVLHNKESQRLQYALADRAKAMGFGDVEVIDRDLGSSAAVGAAARAGFERLLSQVAMGHVGAVLSREVSRLSRTDKDWCRLLELCQLFDTLIVDHEHIYDLSQIDDQLILGIKGTMSVVELKVLRMRMQQGMEEKARRGELIRVLPSGYALDADGKVVRTPDERVREGIALIFRRFKETWSVQGTSNWFRRNGVQVPVNKPMSGHYGITWQLPSKSFIDHVLRSPFYAGAYFYGQRQAEVAVVDGRPVKRRGHRRSPEECRVFLRDHHEGYVDWATHVEISAIIERNAMRVQGREGVAAVRSGHALLASLIRCGTCGRRMRVHYPREQPNGGAYYRCEGTRAMGGARCLHLSGARVDKAVVAEIGRLVSPLGIDAALRAAEKMAAGQCDRHHALEKQLEECEYQAQRAFEQYNEVDPRNRLVAGELERRWNAKLDEVAKLKSALKSLAQETTTPTAEERARLNELGRDFTDVWSTPIGIETKKKIIRTLLEELVAIANDERRRIQLVLHWKGGTHTALELEMLRPHEIQRTSVDDVELIRTMAARGYGDQEIARVLSCQGSRTGKGHRWTAAAVNTARQNYGIAGRKESALDGNVMTLAAAATRTGVSNSTIKNLGKMGVLRYAQVAPTAPWEIRQEDLDAPAVRQALERLRRTGRLRPESATTDSNQTAMALE